MSPTVLVTGAAGFIGSAVVRELSLRNWKVVAVDALLGGLYGPEEKSARFSEISALPGVEAHQLDLRTSDLSQLPPTITHVVNQAAMPGLLLSWQDFELYESCNLGGLARLIEASQEWSLVRFIQVSTSSVYGAEAVGDENQPLRPVSPYGVTKLAAENLVLAHWRSSGFPGTILRYFSVYGPGQRPDMAYRRFIDQALRGQTITVFGSGEQTRSNTYIDDIVEGTVNALAEAPPGEIFNLSGKKEKSINEALEIIEREVGKPISITRKETARGDQARTAGDSSRATESFGFENKVALEVGLKRQVQWQQTLL